MELSPIQNKIYDIRGYKVMLDFDLAEIYQVETRVLNQAVKRNIERFPEDFMFQLTKEEFSNLTSQIVTSSWGGVRKLPFAFTEHGAVMLSSVLRSEIAIKSSVLVVRAFVAARQLVSIHPVDEIKELQYELKKLKQYIEDMFTDQNDINEDTRMQLELINETLAGLQTKNKALDKPHYQVGFNAPQYKQKTGD